MGLNRSQFSETSPFYEVWYFKLNHPEQKAALWVHFNLLNSPQKNLKKAEVFAVGFDEQKGIHTAKTSLDLPLASPFYVWDNAENADCISIGTASWKSVDKALSGETKGGLSGSDRIKWECSIQGNSVDRPFFHVPENISRFKLNRSTVLTPFPNLKFSGFFSVNDHVYEFQNASGMQGHIFGREHARHWAWAHCNQVESGEYFVFEGLCVSTLLGGVLPSPPIALFLIAFEDHRFHLNTLNSALSTKNRLNTTRWDFVAKSGEWRFEGTCFAEFGHMVGVTYEDTHKGNLYCHNSTLASMELNVFYKDAPYKTFRSEKTSAFERVTREADLSVPWLV